MTFTTRKPTLNRLATMKYGEALGYYLFEHHAIDDPHNIGQADVERVPAAPDTDGAHARGGEQAFIRFITRTGEPQFQYLEITPCVEEFLYELLQLMLCGPTRPLPDGWDY